MPEGKPDGQLILFDDLDDWLEEFARQGQADLEELLRKHAAFESYYEARED